MPAADRPAVLFVCTGNICRSPTAEGVFRSRLAARGLDGRVHVDSAGTHGYHVGEPPDPRAIATARDRGVDISGQRARRVHDRDFAAFDLILACDRGHLRQLERLRPEGARARVALLLDFAEGPRGRDVPDPYYGDQGDFDRAITLIEAAADGVLAALTGRSAAS